MAISPPNYTQIPNELLDRMDEMTPAEFKVVMAICRRTFGWHKADEVITVSQLVEMTGMSKPSVLDGIKAAEAHELLTRTLVTKQIHSYHLHVKNPDEPVKDTDRSKILTGQESLPEPVKNPDRQPVNFLDRASLLKKDLKKERNDDDGGSSSSALLESIGGDDDGDDDGADGYDSVDALIDLEFTANQGTDAQAAYREADRPLDAAEVTRIAAWIAEPPPGIQNARGYLASKWKKGELVKMEHEKVKRGPVWDKEHHRFEPQPADLTPDIIQARDRLEAEIEATRGQLDPRVVDVRAAIERFKLKPMPPAGTPDGFWRMAP